MSAGKVGRVIRSKSVLTRLSAARPKRRPAQVRPSRTLKGKTMESGRYRAWRCASRTLFWGAYKTLFCSRIFISKKIKYWYKFIGCARNIFRGKYVSMINWNIANMSKDSQTISWNVTNMLKDSQ